MSTEQRDREIERRAKQVFDASVASIDGHTRSRLAQARNQALETGRRPNHWYLPGRPRLVVAGAVAAALLAAVLVMQPLLPEAEHQLTTFDDLDILLGEEDLEFFEDLEFYAWLDEQVEFDDVVDTIG